MADGLRHDCGLRGRGVFRRLLVAIHSRGRKLKGCGELGPLTGTERVADGEGGEAASRSDWKSLAQSEGGIYEQEGEPFFLAARGS